MAWTSRRAWAVLVALLQALQIIIHISRDLGFRSTTYLLLRLESPAMDRLFALIVGTIVAWREREALASFGITAQPADASSPAKARSIRPIVFSRPKMAAKEPKRGPWLWPSSTS